MQTILVLWVALLGSVPTHEVELTTGEILQGELIEQTADLVVIDHEVLGRLEIPADTVAEVRPLPGAPSAVEQAQADLAAADIAVPEPPPKPRWESRFDLGLGLSQGVTNEANLRLAFTTELAAKAYTYKLESSYYYKQSDDVTTDNKFHAGLLADWPFRASRWSVFGQGTFDFDEFQSWQFRITGGAGLGYLLVDLNEIEIEDEAKLIDAFALTGRFGLGFRREFGSLDDEVSPEGILGGALAWHITDRQNLTWRLTFFPDLRDTGQFRFISRGEWALKLEDLWDGLDLIIGYAYEYQSETDPGVNPNDLRVYASLGIGF